MATYREPDPLAELLTREHERVVECIKSFATGEGTAGALSEARNILHALAAADDDVLGPAFARVSLRPEAQRLAEDARIERARQLTALEVLSHKRSPRLRKLGALDLCDLLEHHARQHRTLLIPVLASQLPRPMYRAVASAFATRYRAALEPARRTSAPRPEASAEGRVEV